MSNLLETAPAADPFEASLTTASNRLQALQKVKLAQEHLREIRARAHQNIERAEADVVEAMRAASAMGAYNIIPVEARPAMPVVSAAQA